LALELLQKVLSLIATILVIIAGFRKFAKESRERTSYIRRIDIRMCELLSRLERELKAANDEKAESMRVFYRSEPRHKTRRKVRIQQKSVDRQWELRRNQLEDEYAASIRRLIAERTQYSSEITIRDLYAMFPQHGRALQFLSSVRRK